MYQANPEFEQPNENERVWRYMDFTKLVSLLHSRTLYFARADKFDDPFEGSYPAKNVSRYRDYHESLNLPPDVHRDLVPLLNDGMSTFVRRCRKWTALNCWHLSDYESAAMWRLYLKGSDGIAIMSSYGRLRNSFKNTSEQIYIGKVRYIDYQRDSIDGTSIFSPFLYKRNSFTHEREVRALISKLPIRDGGLDFAQESIEDGINIDVDLSLLVETIYVVPYAPKWVHNAVKSVVERYGCTFEVRQSDIEHDPLY